MKKTKFFLLGCIVMLASLTLSAQNALNFDGVNDYVQTTYGGVAGNGARTIEAWIKTTANALPVGSGGTGQKVIVDYGTFINGQRFTMNLLWGNSIRLEVGGSGVSGNLAINDGLWHHVAVVHNPMVTNNILLYIDGILNVSGSLIVNTTSANSLKIGQRIDGVNSFSGDIDDVRVWNVARTANEISTNMSLCLTGAEAGLVAFYNFEDGTGSAILTDGTANSNNGTLTNMDPNTDWVAGYGTCANCTPLAGSLAPDIAMLPDLTDPCSVALTAPTGTNSCGTVIGTPSIPFPITTQGTTVVTWTFSDGTNTITQTQNVIISDVTPPTFDIATLPDSTYWCKALVLDIPTATDNCSGVVNGTTNTVLPITTGGLNVVTWTYTDSAGNSISQTQNITIDVINTGISQLNPTTLTADFPGAVYLWLDCDNGNATIPGAVNQTYSPLVSGNYAVVLFFNGCSDTSACFPFSPVGINELNSITTSIFPNPATNVINVNLGTQVAQITYSLRSITGEIIKTNTMQNTDAISIDISDAAKGVYFLKLNHATYKVIKE